MLERLADRGEERQVQAAGWRRHVFEVGEHSAGFEQVEDLRVQGPLALVLEMMDGHGGHDGVKAPERRQRLGQVVLDQLDALVAGESFARRGEHWC